MAAYSTKSILRVRALLSSDPEPVFGSSLLTGSHPSRYFTHFSSATRRF